MTFYLGTHQVCWLARTDVPLFISARRLRPLTTLPRARGPWALDSGGFTEISTYGAWKTPATIYAREAERWQRVVGNLQWAAPQDWMCEPKIREMTGLSVSEHQRRSVASVIELRQLAPSVPWIPVLQGWDVEDYAACVSMYTDQGIDVTREPVVGVGTVCRRQSTREGAEIIRRIAALGVRIHGFGFKQTGLPVVGHLLASADSMAWSLNARKNPPLPECRHGETGTGKCANCLKWALRWRERLLGALPKSVGEPK